MANYDNETPTTVNGEHIYMTEFEVKAAKEVRLFRCEGCTMLVSLNALQECDECDLGNLCPLCVEDPSRHGCGNG